MFANRPTWTTERVELLKGHFDAGLSCREIAAAIGVSRNAVIGKLARLELTRGPARAKPRPDKTARERSRKSIPRLQYRMLQDVYEHDSRRSRSRSPVSAAARCSNSAMNDAAGRSARPAPRIFAFAATRRWKACPIARGTPASPIGPARASGSRADNDSVFERKPAPDLIRGGYRFRASSKSTQIA